MDDGGWSANRDFAHRFHRLVECCLIGALFTNAAFFWFAKRL
jgi:hypothetical protein